MKATTAGSITVWRRTCRRWYGRPTSPILLELHTSLSLAKDILRPSFLAFDLDPGPPANIVLCCQVAIWIREYLRPPRPQVFPKTSSSKGMQVYVPLNTPVTYGQTKPFAHEMARLLERHNPKLVVSDMKKALRVGKVSLDSGARTTTTKRQSVFIHCAPASGPRFPLR